MNNLRTRPDELAIYAERRVIQGTIALHLVRDDGAGVFQVAQPLVMKDSAPAIIVDPFVELPMAMAQQLMDELWNAGVRPTEQGSAGQLAATERHLADMRQLAFHALKVDQGVKRG